MARAINIARQRNRSKGIAVPSFMAHFWKKPRPSIAPISTVMPQYVPSFMRDRKAAHRCGAIMGASSVLALDFTMRKAALELGSEPRGLRDDWVAIGNDLRVVSGRVNCEIQRNELPQGSLLPPGD